MAYSRLYARWTAQIPAAFLLPAGREGWWMFAAAALIHSPAARFAPRWQRRCRGRFTAPAVCTSRYCWTYHTGEIPPPVAVFAHGFAAVAFARALAALERCLAAVGLSVSVASRTAATEKTTPM